MTKKHAKMPFFNLTKWYFHPKWKFNTSSDFLPMTKRRNFQPKDKLLIINEIQNYSKHSKKRAGRNFLGKSHILIIYWLSIYCNKTHHFHSQISLQIHSLLSFRSNPLPMWQIIYFLTFQQNFAVFFSAFQSFSKNTTLKISPNY